MWFFTQYTHTGKKKKDFHPCNWIPDLLTQMYPNHSIVKSVSSVLTDKIKIHQIDTHRWISFHHRHTYSLGVALFKPVSYWWSYGSPSYNKKIGLSRSCQSIFCQLTLGNTLWGKVLLKFPCLVKKLCEYSGGDLMEQPSRTCASRLNFCHPAGKNGFNQGEGGEVFVRPDRSKTIRSGDIAGAYHLPLLA